jgi:hypothetical protein
VPVGIPEDLSFLFLDQYVSKIVKGHSNISLVVISTAELLASIQA